MDDLVDLVSAGDVAVLSGAGLSTESGIPDYRGPDGTRRVEPMSYGTFVGSSEARRRYWARSYIGWQRFSQAAPNRGHHDVAALQEGGYLGAVITQNVDGLHQAAGTRDVVELHGSLDRAVCLTCGETTTRDGLHERMTEANPGFLQRFVDRAAAVGSQWGEQVRPDGDIVLSDDLVDSFHAPRCLVCDRDTVKPAVVFFGESVPKSLVERCFALVESAGALLVLGSSLSVMSGYRFVRRAAARGIPVAIVTKSATRGDAEATIRLHESLGDTLAALRSALVAGF
ncbi:MAG TPA: Sir2 family NAD-dependent protein deacetylase [Intrasporangium sp.]|uniref:Sir2 family NAD-dependent protein deacetylase n=1 Tax=Intrasporangium sp. TaxID=1925024 RepID=UPI002D77A631|nr:Sir2 family NAD-dependent protein deacetylase [Intrasporangium sp.]HET7397984.1 Sir2 family NAD-dependent protein deacetylase [Intrasporangium sp.]